MACKLICIDMDGTLLNSNDEISRRNLEAIRKASENGVQVAISTGRLFVSANYYADLIGVKTPVIASNGAYIRDKNTDKVIYKSLLGYENCKKVINVAKKYDMYAQFNTYDSIFTEKLVYSSKFYSKMNETLPEDRRVNIKITSDWDESFKKYKNEILKCIVIDKDCEKLKLIKEELLKEKGIQVVSSFRNNVEVMAKGVSKGNAVGILADFYNLTREEIMCIGDSENDLSMIEFAGIGVAMGNGDELIKRSSDYITDTNDEDGVAKAIEKFVL
ncbi:putative phosphatase YwpJ [Clostridium liquoris]|uniref:Putative phosphatase YwpJ n=1 Tax=Clostridium liquoris TaxID=1289519 RepID=A0A2T0B6E8_9CLOT|nr:Cof-type HAD-IIB family hydrolase [Clostridium liquoris]PRR79456.1 putative phosphatase YwpJ [Clostridium liquoris]